jgi:hypothetical protein
MMEPCGVDCTGSCRDVHESQSLLLLLAFLKDAVPYVLYNVWCQSIFLDKTVHDPVFSIRTINHLFMFLCPPRQLCPHAQ